MKTISRYIMTLALLLTAVGGAWAQVADYNIYVNFEPDYHPMQTHFNCMIMNMMDPSAEIKGTLSLSVDGISMGSFEVDGEMVDDQISPGLDAGDHTYEAVFHPEGGGSFNANGGFTIDKADTYIIYYGSTSINLGVGESTELVVSLFPDGQDGLSYSSSDASVASITKMEYSDYYIIQANAAGTATITFSFAGNTNYDAAKEDKTITVTVLTPPIDVTTNKAENDTVFTEASFTMPAYDATAEYELVRDMSISMTATMGDGTDGVRYRVKKAQQGEGYEPADMDMMQVLTLVAVNDGIEQKDLTLEEDYFCRIYKLDEQTLQPEGDGVTLYDFDFAPGLYALKAFATDGSDYAGETAFSNTFKLFQGYEVEVAAGEFATFYKDEPLYADPESSADAKLYTIQSVSDDKAVLSNAIETAPSLTPLLIFNNSDETKTFLLIPATAEPNIALTVAPEFQGTLTGTTIAASTEGTTNYALNGKQFVFVKNAIEVGPNKAWLSISNSNARSISIVFDDETTSIKNLTPALSEGEGVFYDLNGRKLDKMPTKKGVYLFNGKKVVVK